MAVFEIQQLEGLRSVRVLLDDENLQAESGALATMDGDIDMVARIPSPLSALRSVISGQSIILPKYYGKMVLNSKRDKTCAK